MPQETAHARFRWFRCGNEQCPVAPVLPQTRHSLSPPCHASTVPTQMSFPCGPLLCTSGAPTLEEPKLLYFRTVGNRPGPKGRWCFLSSTHMWPAPRPWPRVGLITMFFLAFPISSCLSCCPQSRWEDKTLGFSPKTSSALVPWVISCVKVHVF